MVTANDVSTNSIHVAPLPAMTNVYFNFRYEDKSPEVIMEIIRRHIQKQVVIAGGETNVAQGVLEGVLSSNNIPVGLVLSFETREEAEKARQAKRTVDPKKDEAQEHDQERDDHSHGQDH